MTQRRALGDLDFDSAFDDPDNGWFGHVPVGDPVSSRDHEDLPRDHSDVVDSRGLLEPPPDEHALDGTEDTDRWPVSTTDSVPPPDVAEEDSRVFFEPDPGPAVEPAVGRWSDGPASPSWESRLSSSGAWDFKVAPASPRRYPPKSAVAGVIVAALLATGVVLFVRSPGPTADQPPIVAPSQSTAQSPPANTVPSPAPSSQVPPSQGPPAPPPPPPPPSPTAEQLTPPVVTRDYTPRRQNAPDDSSKPEIGVTRAPATRTQMSATPPVPGPAPGRNSGTPGDSDRRGGFGFGF